MGVATEREILPLFQQLWAVRGQEDTAALEQMHAVQAGLREQFAARLSE